MGPPGLAGPQGPAGPKGDPGVSGRVVVEREFTFDDQPEFYNGQVNCPGSKQVIGGGVSILGGSTNYIPIKSIPDSNGWEVTIMDTNVTPLISGELRFLVRAICADVQ